MRKPMLYPLILLLLISLAFSACSAGQTQPSPAPEAPPAQSTPAPQPAPEPQEETESTPAPAPNPPAEPESAPVPESEGTPDAEPMPETKPIPEAEAEPTEGGSAQQAPSAADDLSSKYHEKVPILMYHEVNDLLANSLYLSVADFAAHLSYFEEAGITPITMQQLYDHWFNEAPLPEKPIVLTFDDGYTSMYTTVYPMLKERGWSGTFFCITNLRWSEGHLSEEQIREMAAGGMEIGSHTVSHLELNSLSRENLYHELTVSKNVLSDFVGADVPMLCYPAGRYDEATKVAAAETGYLCAVTTQYGFASKSQGMFDLKRIRVSTDCGGGWMRDVLSPLGY